MLITPPMPRRCCRSIIDILFVIRADFSLLLLSPPCFAAAAALPYAMLDDADAAFAMPAARLRYHDAAFDARRLMLFAFDFHILPMPLIAVSPDYFS